MKTCKLFIALTTLTAGMVLAQQLEYWNFDDANGTDLNDLSNSGSLGSNWNFNTTTGAIGGGGHLTNGSGQWVMAGDAGAGGFTRKLPDGLNEDAGLNNEYASPISTGIYTLDVTFDSWDVTNASVGDSWKLGINDQNSSSTTIAQIIFEKDSVSTTRLRWASTTVGGARFRNVGFGLTESSEQKLTVEFDFDNSTLRYLLNDVEQHSFTDFNGAQIGQLLYVTNGVWNDATSSVTLESMGVTAIPEPGTLAMTGIAFLALAGACLRRH